MTAATSLLSPGVPDSPWIIDAILRTSYGERFLLRAYDMSTFFQFWQNAVSCAWTSCFDGSLAMKKYVDGNRKPSGFFCNAGVKHGTRRCLVAAKYAREASLTVLSWCSAFAILATAPTCETIWVRVKPSGKMILYSWGGGGGAIVWCRWMCGRMIAPAAATTSRNAPMAT